MQVICPLIQVFTDKLVLKINLFSQRSECFDVVALDLAAMIRRLNPKKSSGRTILPILQNCFYRTASREMWLKKRSSLDIISTILEAANGGIGKTRLLEKANLTTSQFAKYSTILVSKKLLTESVEGSRQAYKTTELGIQYVTLYGAIKSTLYLNSLTEQ